MAGSSLANCRRKLPSISITVTSKAIPKPSESTTVGVSALGRWILATAMRKAVERARGMRAAINISSAATRRNKTKTAAAVAT